MGDVSDFAYDLISAGYTMDEAIDNAKEAIELWLETVIDDGGTVPVAQAITTHGELIAVVQLFLWFYHNGDRG